MTTNLVTIETGSPVSEARELLENGNIHHLPVIHAGRLAGILSWNDLLRVSFGEMGNQDGRGLDAMLDHTYKLVDIMNSSPTTLDVSCTVRDAAQVLASQSFHSLPVVDGDKLVGMVTSTDLIQYLSDQY